MNSAVKRAIDHVQRMAKGTALPSEFRVTVNFHPDSYGGGRSTIEQMAQDGYLRSQFETRTSNGGLTAFVGGARWTWESRIFGGAYDNAAPAFRPKYGALNHGCDPMGASRRFGSCHFRLAPHVLEWSTFCYPDSHLTPEDFGTASSFDLIHLWDENKLGLDPLLDNYIEAHIHGSIFIEEAVEAIVLDPSYRDTFVEAAAHTLGCTVEWHKGFQLTVAQLDKCRKFRGEAAAEAIACISENGSVTPQSLGKARDTILPYQIAKSVWHCIAMFGEVRP
jgi:hypothetical protein